MLFQHSMSITQQLMPIYNITVHKNLSIVALNVAKLLVLLDTNMPQGQKFTSDPLEYILKEVVTEVDYVE